MPQQTRQPAIQIYSSDQDSREKGAGIPGETLTITIGDSHKVEAKVNVARERVSLSVVIEGLLKQWIAGKIETPQSKGGVGRIGAR